MRDRYTARQGDRETGTDTQRDRDRQRQCERKTSGQRETKRDRDRGYVKELVGMTFCDLLTSVLGGSSLITTNAHYTLHG